MKFLTALFLFGISLIAVGQSDFPNDWQRMERANNLWSEERLKRADMVASEIGTTAYMVVHKGQIAHSYGNITHPTNIHSVRKSILSILYGMRLERCNFTLASTISDLRIDDKDSLSQTEKMATVSDLLKSRSGVYHRAAAETESMSRLRPQRGAFKPNEWFYYNNWDFNTLGTIFNNFCGVDVFTALETELAVELKFQDFKKWRDTKWERESHSSQHPAYLVRLSTRDMARVGLLMLRKGVADRRLFSETWFYQSTTSYSKVSESTGYGYMWWIGVGDKYFQHSFGGKVFNADGNGGQYILVDMADEIVIVHKVNTENTNYRTVTRSKFAELVGAIYSAKLRSAN